MCNRKKVLSANNGNLSSKVVFVAEAPGRLGAECSGIPLYGDKTGENFDMLIGNIGWKREDIFITNSLLCNPQDDNGNNSTPTQVEIENCSYYLEMTLGLINPDVVITLGIKALEAIKIICNHNFTLRDNVAKKLPWNDRFLVPLYHMGPRAAIHRNLIKQRADFIELSHIVDPIKGIKKQTKINVAKKITEQGNILVDMVMEILNELKTVSFFKLTKLLYLIDYGHYKDFGTSISGSVYLRMQEGPWIPSLRNISKECGGRLFKNTFHGKKPVLSYMQNNHTSQLTDEQRVYIKKIVQQYADSSDAIMKIAAYRTAPMKHILAEEKAGRNMTRIPVLYKDSSVLDADKQDE
jgi:uracil-DNA glycosylase family 4